MADQRRYYREGTLEASRVSELEKLGMVWSVHASAWDAGLAVARDYAAVHGHCLPGAGVVWDGYPLGVFLKNARAAAKKARENAVRRANGEEGVSSAGELSESRMEALAEIDPGWAPEWEIGWQRSYRLLLAHVKAGGELPAGPGDVVVQGEDLAVWVAGQVAGWERLVPAQQYLLESLGVHPESEGCRWCRCGGRRMSGGWPTWRRCGSFMPARVMCGCRARRWRSWTGCRTRSARSWTMRGAGSAG